MPIYSYQKFITHEISKYLALPIDPVTSEPQGTELATINDVAYVFIPDGVPLSVDQPEEIASSIKSEVLTNELREDIKAASPHCKLIAQRVIDKIRERYSADEEQYFARIGIGVALGIYTFEPGESDALAQFGVYVEQCRQWGRDQRAALGL